MHACLQDGAELATALRHTGGDECIVIGVTGNALQADREEFLRAGAVQVLTKPVTAAIIRASLDSLRLVVGVAPDSDAASSNTSPGGPFSSRTPVSSSGDIGSTLVRIQR